MRCGSCTQIDGSPLNCLVAASKFWRKTQIWLIKTHVGFQGDPTSEASAEDERDADHKVSGCRRDKTTSEGKKGHNHNVGTADVQDVH